MKGELWMNIRNDRLKGLSYMEIGKKHNIDRRTAKKYAHDDKKPKYKYGIRLNCSNGYWLITESDLQKHDEYIKLIKNPVGFDDLINTYTMS